MVSLRALNSSWNIHIIDDNSSEHTRELLKQTAPEATFDWLPWRDQSHLTSLQKSRHSVGVMLDRISQLPKDHLVYVVEDDYLHYPHSLSVMLNTWAWFTALDPQTHVGIFPQDFNQLYYHPGHAHNQTYVGPCLVVAGPDRYFRTTWFTQETFMISHEVIEKYQEHFDSLMTIGFEPGRWEGNTIAAAWAMSDVQMLMPLGTLAIHLGQEHDISFYVRDLDQLWAGVTQ